MKSWMQNSCAEFKSTTRHRSKQGAPNKGSKLSLPGVKIEVIRDFYTPYDEIPNERKNVDIYERVALILENDQNRRYRQVRKPIDFYTPEEVELFEFIKEMRKKSETYDHLKPR